MKILSYIKNLFLANQLRVMAFIAGAAMLSLVYYMVQRSGALEERAAIATVQVEANKEGVKTGAKIDQTVISYSDDDLDRRYSRWLRD